MVILRDIIDVAYAYRFGAAIALLVFSLGIALVGLLLPLVLFSGSSCSLGVLVCADLFALASPLRVVSVLLLVWLRLLQVLALVRILFVLGPFLGLLLALLQLPYLKVQLFHSLLKQLHLL